MKNYKKIEELGKYYDRVPEKGVIYHMWFVYQNEAGERYVSTCCDFELVEMGYMPTGKVVYSK